MVLRALGRKKLFGCKRKREKDHYFVRLGGRQGKIDKVLARKAHHLILGKLDLPFFFFLFFSGHRLIKPTTLKKAYFNCWGTDLVFMACQKVLSKKNNLTALQEEISRLRYWYNVRRGGKLSIEPC